MLQLDIARHSKLWRENSQKCPSIGIWYDRHVTYNLRYRNVKPVQPLCLLSISKSYINVTMRIIIQCQAFFVMLQCIAASARELQIFEGIDRRCETLMNNTIENIFAQKDCSCSQGGFPPTLTVDCSRIEESCIQRRFTDTPDDNLLCGYPGIRFVVNVLAIAFGGLPVVAEVCFYDVSVFNITVPDIINPVCIGVFAGLPGSIPLANLLGLIFGITAPASKALREPSKPSSLSLKKKHQAFRINENSCVPVIGNEKEKCNSCTICPPEEGGGIIFDCTNIVPDLQSTDCVVLPKFL